MNDLDHRELTEIELDGVTGGMLAAISGGLATKQTDTELGELLIKLLGSHLPSPGYN